MMEEKNPLLEDMDGQGIRRTQVESRSLLETHVAEQMCREWSVLGQQKSLKRWRELCSMRELNALHSPAIRGFTENLS